jgi:hypothetical protein
MTSTERNGPSERGDSRLRVNGKPPLEKSEEGERVQEDSDGRNAPLENGCGTQSRSTREKTPPASSMVERHCGVSGGIDYGCQENIGWRAGALQPGESELQIGELTMRHRLWLVCTIAIGTLLLACSSAPPVPEGNKIFGDALTTLKSSDFDATLRNLDKAIKAAPDDTAKMKAVMLRTALVAAQASAYKAMAEAYYTGAKQPKAAGRTGGFYKQRSDYYSTGASLLMDAMQSVMNQRAKLGDKTMPLEVVFPGFTGTNPGLLKIKDGQLVGDPERIGAEQQADRDELAVVLSSIAGAGQDPQKGKDAYVNGKAEIDPRVYIIELSNSFLQSGAMFEVRGLNQPDKLKTVTDVVKGNLEIATKLLAAKPDKALEARVKKILADCDKGTKPGKKG